MKPAPGRDIDFGTLVDWATDEIKTAIVTGEFAAGERLTTTGLAKKLRLSLTPVREAIQRLVTMGLVETMPQRAFRVAALDRAELWHLYELRFLVEPIALRQSLANSDQQHKGEIKAAFEEMIRVGAGSATRAADASEAHERFHESLVARCPSGVMRRVLTQLGEHSNRYRAIARDVVDPAAARDQHRELMQAAIAGDAETLAATHLEHLRTTLALVDAALDTDVFEPSG